MELISIITPAYNAVAFLAQAIESVQEQTYVYWEMLIVDDHSTDATVDLIKRYQQQDNRIKLLQTPVNGGPAAARNVGIQQARGVYLAFLDADDYWLPEKLAVQRAYMIEREAAFSFTAYRRIAQDNQRWSEVVQVDPKVDYASLLNRTQIATLTVMLDRRLFDSIEMAAGVGHEDYLLWLQLLKQTPYAHGIQQDLARYRVVENSVSSNYLTSVQWVWNIYRRHEHLSLLSATRHLCSYAYYAFRKRMDFALTLAPDEVK